MTEKINISETFRAALPAVAFVAAIFFFNFISRMVLAPLMPVIQLELGFTHAGAGHLFLTLAIGNGIGLLLSGFLSRAVNHRRTVGVSAVLTGTAVMLTPLADSYATLLVGVFGLGLAVGLYLPSGIAVITSLVRKEDWGKGLSVHELAPSTSFVIAPLLAETLLLFTGWRSVLYLLGVLQICLGLWFLRSGRGGEFPGMIPSPSLIRSIGRKPIFWLFILFFSLAVGASVGAYSMLPLYLVDAHGYTREQANQLLSASRVLACFVPLLSGWLTDRWGPRLPIFLFLILSGFAVIALGLTSGPVLVGVALFQPAFTVLMFAPGFTMLSVIFQPEHRSVAVALMGPANALFGLGLVPTFLGHMGDEGLFHVGFIILGMIILSAMFFLPVLPKGRADQIS